MGAATVIPFIPPRLRRYQVELTQMGWARAFEQAAILNGDDRERCICRGRFNAISKWIERLVLLGPQPQS